MTRESLLKTQNRKLESDGVAELEEVGLLKTKPSLLHHPNNKATYSIYSHHIRFQLALPSGKHCSVMRWVIRLTFRCPRELFHIKC